VRIPSSGFDVGLRRPSSGFMPSAAAGLAAGRPLSGFVPLAGVGLRSPSSDFMSLAAGLAAGSAAPAGVANPDSTNNAASSGAVVSLIMRLLLQIAITSGGKPGRTLNG
jgi:hypothetical protein